VTTSSLQLAPALGFDSNDRDINGFQPGELLALKCMDFPRQLHAFASRVSQQRRATPHSNLPIQLGTVALLVFVLLDLPAQNTSNCHGPTALEKTISEHPSAAAYDALSAHFASQSRFSCAISAFKAAIRLDPDSWQGYYNLGVAMLTSGDAQQAAQQLKTALVESGSEQILLPLGARTGGSGGRGRAMLFAAF
jgi:tetratricopeptide (TPR) repeat protein